MSASNRILDYAVREIESVEIQGVFLTLMTAFLLGTGFHERIKALEVNKDHPVWPFLEEYLKDVYQISLSDYLTAPKSGTEA